VKSLAIKTALLGTMLAACFTAAPRLNAQTQGDAPGQPAQNAAQSPAKVQTQSDQNPFPDDTSSVPLMSTHKDDLPADLNDDADSNRIPLPAEDADPVRTPEQAAAASEEGQQNFSSSLTGMGNLLPSSDAETQPSKRGRKGKQQVVEEHQETAAEDESVGNYYLDKKDWRAALSRFQSAMVLDPDNPDVYWGLAESQRHLGDLAGARSNYQKVVDYDPDSRHGKDARKALKEPQIANAKPSATIGVAAPVQQ